VGYVLDSTVIIDFVVGYPPGEELVERLFAQYEPLYVCDVVTCESLSKGRADEVGVARNLLQALEYVALAPEDARWAGDRRRIEIEAGRRKPSTSDALIAALARGLGATVVTRNAKDFAAFDVPVLGYGEADGLR
jgi:predicted nucleic acid-binding protein